MSLDLLDKPQIARILINDLYRVDFAMFVAKVFETVCPGDTYLENWHIEAICYEIMEIVEGRNNRLIINMPPRSLKSIIVSVALPAWLLGRDPSFQVIVVSHSDRLAGILSGQFRTVISSSWYRELFPKMKVIKDTETLTRTSKAGARMATTVEGTITGIGADMLIVDDPAQPEDMNSENTRDKINRWFSETLYSRLNDKENGAIIVVQQRLHGYDLSGYLLEKGGYRHLTLPAIAIEPQSYRLVNGATYRRKTGEALHAAREPVNVLEETRAMLGDRTFIAQYQQLPVPADGNHFKREWFRYYKEPPLKGDGEVFFSCDAAAKTGEHNDYSVVMVFRFYEKKSYLIDLVRARVEITELVRIVEDLNRRYSPKKIIIEDASSGIALGQMLSRSIGKSYIDMRKPDGDKVSRALSVVDHLEKGDVLFPEESPWLEELEKELLSFSHGRHDDQVDALVYYLHHISNRKPDREFF